MTTPTNSELAHQIAEAIEQHGHFKSNQRGGATPLQPKPGCWPRGCCLLINPTLNGLDYWSEADFLRWLRRQLGNGKVSLATLSDDTPTDQLLAALMAL